jgi:predicted nuclease of predicted toxin-antitoxin system
MRFLVDADLPRRTAAVVAGHSHEAIDVRDIGVYEDSDIAEYARTNQLCLISCDFGFADIRNYSPSRYCGLVVLRLPNNATADTKLELLQSLLRQPDIVSRLPGRLAIVGTNGIRLRPR